MNFWLILVKKTMNYQMLAFYHFQSSGSVYATVKMYALSSAKITCSQLVAIEPFIP